MIKESIDALEKIGLKREEAKVYLACLRSDDGLFMHEIAHLSGIKRSTVNLIIERLLARNFLGSYSEGRRRKFVAEDPDRLVFDFQRDLEDFQAAIPKILQRGKVAEHTRVTLHEGSKGMKAVLDELILTLKNKPVKDRINYTFITGHDIAKHLPRFQKQFIERRVKNRIPCHMIALRTAPKQPWPSSEKEMRTVKTFDGKKLPMNIEIDIADDKVGVFLFGHNHGALTIQNKVLAASLRSLFNIVWENLGTPEKGSD